MIEEESSSFFEKKEPKKLLTWGHGLWTRQRPQTAKVFCRAIFQKRACFLLLPSLAFSDPQSDLIQHLHAERLARTHERADAAQAALLAEQQVEAAAALRRLENQTGGDTVQLAQLEAQQAVASQRLGAAQSALGRLLPVMQRLSAEPAATMLAAPLSATDAVRGVTIRVEGLERNELPTVRSFVRGRPFYMVNRRDGYAVLGASTDERGDSVIEAGELSRLLRDALDLVPALESATVLETRIGLRPASANLQPFFEVLGESRWAWSSGHYRHGVTLAPLAANDALHFVQGTP